MSINKVGLRMQKVLPSCRYLPCKTRTSEPIVGVQNHHIILPALRVFFHYHQQLEGFGWHTVIPLASGERLKASLFRRQADYYFGLVSHPTLE